MRANILYLIGENPAPPVESTVKVRRSLALTCSHLHSNATSVRQLRRYVPR
ncbi:hypothetical protein WH47_10898 [Habropoda laboriosa]|uniref:Uncharacterized protein n=1 Tax=Habropoda laboriosa TaxID=597456 RepID=A0A0L7RDN8_9HYME|nr:hypothetical protein WH47_10898 [Habropoda laboriosa]